MAGAPHGGAEAFFMRLVPALQRAGVQQLVVMRRDAGRLAKLRAAGIEPVEVSFGGRLDFTTPLVMRREIRGFKPHIVMTWMNRATHMCPRGKFIHVSRLGGYYDLKYYQACDHLIANTEDIRDYLINEGWPAEKAHYLPNFADDTPAAPVRRTDYYTPDRGKLILALGRLHPNKGFDVLLQSLVRLPEAYLWIAGEGPLRQDLEALAQRLGVKPRVRFLGWRDDVPALLAACDVFVCPSRHEPLGNVVLEAWAHGKPVVAADAVGPGMLIQQMENGILVPVDDAEALANGMRAVLDDDDLRAQLGREGRATFEAEFSEPIVVAKYVAFFESLLGESSA
ncbi:MAG: glycosyltransferase [Rhodospirillales bacterium]|nr:glycosyltransferase [Rhodospirillales bacterium]